MLSDVFAMTLNTLRIELPFYQSQLQGEYRRAGLWRAFNPLTQTVVELLEGGATTSRRTTTYTYNLSATGDGGQYGNLLSVEERDQNSAVVRTTAYSYATRDDTGAYLVDRPWQELTRNGANGIVSLTHTFYDDQNITAKALGTRGLPTRVLGYASLNNATTLSGTYQGQDTVATYDLWGNKLTTVTYAGYGSGTVSGSSWSYSAPGGGSTARTTTTTYNDNSLRVFPTQVTYPTVGGVTLSEQAGYDYRMGTLTSVTDANGVVTSATYDLFGRLDKLVEAGDSTTNPTEDVDYYDTEKPFRVLVKQRETAGSSAFRPVQHFYDGLGRLIQEKTESINVTTSAGQNIIVDTRYNGLGLVTQSAQARYVSENSSTTFYKYTPVPGSGINWTTTAYDLLGRPLTITQPDTTATSYSYTIDTALLMAAAQTVNARGHKSRQLTDSLDRLRKVEEYSGTSPSWTLYAATTYEYDALDRLTVGTDQKGNLSSVGYDSLGRKGTLLDPDMGSWSYMYDPNSNLIRQTDSRGQRVCFFYDALGRPTGQQHNGSNATCPASPTTITYSYDTFVSGSNFGKGRRTGMTSTSHSVAWKYNARGQVTEASHTVAGVTRVFQWTYDSAERQVDLTYPPIGASPAEKVTTTYDPAWRPKSLCGSTCYIGDGALWTALGQPDSWIYGDGLLRDWRYEPQMQRLKGLAVSYLGKPAYYDRTYTYDAVGNVATIANYRSGRTDRFTYDHRDRLVHAWTTLTMAGGPAPLSMTMGGPEPEFSEPALVAETSATSGDSSQLAATLEADGQQPEAAIQATSRRPKWMPSTPTEALPLIFVPNTGQTDARVQFLSPSPGRSVFFTADGVVMALGFRERLPGNGQGQSRDKGGRRDGYALTTLRYSGANGDAPITATEQRAETLSSFIGADPARWRTNLPTYDALSYEQLYPGIALRFDGVEGQLKSTYTVAPGGNPNQIRWRYDGAQSIAVDPEGRLLVTLPVTITRERAPEDAPAQPQAAAVRATMTLTEETPLAWQERNGVTVPVAVGYAVSAEQEVSFTLGAYDPTVPLTIDPTLTYSTFLGGSGSDTGAAIAVDGAGQSVIAGDTTSTDFPGLGAPVGGSDLFVIKLNSSGVPVQRTLVGGSGYETITEGNGDVDKTVAVDASGNIYVAGDTNSTNFPTTTGAYDRTCGTDSLCNSGFDDAFIIRLNTSGNLTYGTYLGANGLDSSAALALDSSAAVYLTLPAPKGCRVLGSAARPTAEPPRRRCPRPS